MKARLSDVIEGWLFVGVGVLGLEEALRIEYQRRSVFREFRQDVEGAIWFLAMVSGTLLICGVIYLFQAHSRRPISQGDSADSQDRCNILILLLPFVYVAVIPVAGYLLSSLGFFVATVYIMGLRAFWKAVVAGVALTLFFGVVFLWLGKLWLPQGPLPLDKLGIG